MARFDRAGSTSQRNVNQDPRQAKSRAPRRLDGLAGTNHRGHLVASDEASDRVGPDVAHLHHDDPRGQRPDAPDEPQETAKLSSKPHIDQAKDAGGQIGLLRPGFRYRHISAT